MIEPVTRLRADRNFSAESPIERIRRLEAEARDESHALKSALVGRLLDAAKECSEVSGLESLPAGVREALRQLGERIEGDVQNVQSITARTS